VLVCDWDGDGKKDLIFGMIGGGEHSEYYDWPHQDADPSQDMGFFFTGISVRMPVPSSLSPMDKSR